MRKALYFRTLALAFVLLATATPYLYTKHRLFQNEMDLKLTMDGAKPMDELELAKLTMVLVLMAQNNGFEPELYEPVFKHKFYLSKTLNDSLTSRALTNRVVFRESDRAGVCFYWADTIVFDEESWKSYTPNERLSLFLHEVGHCVFGFDHSKEANLDIMNSVTLSDKEISSRTHGLIKRYFNKKNLHQIPN
jgi:hypothetical protein